MSEADIVPGLKFRDNFGLLYHVCGVVQYADDTVVVLRRWLRRYKCWSYLAYEIALFLLHIDEGYYRQAKGK